MAASAKCCCAFTHIPKTGGQSVHALFDKAGSVLPSHHEPTKVQKAMYPKYWDKWFSFCFVRNPWDRLVSLYHYRLKFHHPDDQELFATKYVFKDWVRYLYETRPDNFEPGRPYPLSALYKDCWWWITDDQGEILVDYVARFENYTEEWLGPISKGLREASPDNPLPGTDEAPLKRNTTKHEDFRVYYDDAAVDMVAEMCRPDIVHFNYRFEK